MSSDFLDDLYNGKIYPAENIRPRDKSYWDSAKEQGRQYDELLAQCQRIEPSLAARLSEVMEKRVDLLSEELAVTFTEGFRLGAKMMIAVLDEGEMG